MNEGDDTMTHHPMPTSPRTLRAWLKPGACAALVLTSAFTLSACQREAQAGAQAPIAPPEIQGITLRFAANSPQLKVLQVAPVAAQQERVLDVPGRVAWDESRTGHVLAPVAGRILSLDVQPGQTVQAGQLLARLSAPEFGQAQADAARAQADAHQAAQALARARDLLSAGAIAQRDLEAAQADAERAQAEQARAQARLAGYGGGTAVNQQVALRSPVRGVLVERNALLGQEVRPDQVAPGTPALFTVTDPTRVWVWFDVPEGQAAQVRLDQQIDVRLDNETLLTAKVEQVSDALDPATRSLRLRANLPNSDRRLKGEMFVRGQLHLPTAAAQPVIPADAALLIRGQHVVFVQQAEGRFERRAVRVLESGPGELQVLDGLKVGERVVTQGALMLQQAWSNGGTGAGA